MPHNHSGCQSPKDYFTEQLLTILVCGGLGFVAVQLYLNDMLKHILAPQFHVPVVIGGVGVFVLVALRAVSVWREAGELVPAGDPNDPTCQVNHTHTAACNHLPGMPGAPELDENLVDDHGHSHDMSWVFARMLILVFPIALFALGIPNAGLSKEAQEEMLRGDIALDPAALEKLADESPIVEEVTEPNGDIVRVRQTEKVMKIRDVIVKATGKRTVSAVAEGGTAMRFNDLTEAAFDEGKRKSYEGQTAIMEGRFQPLGGGKEFTLFRQKMTCCGPDAVMLKVRIIAPQSVSDLKYFQWVRVKGVVQFLKAPGSNQYIPVVVLQDRSDITEIPENQIKNQYEF